VLPALSDIHAEQAHRSFYEFVKLMWPVLEPGRPFVDGLHIRLICDALEKVTRGEIARLLINLPPRHGKSNLVSILWPAWVWIDQPDRRWLTASYAQPLAERHSTDTRRLIESPRYQELFGHVYQLSSDVNQKARYENTHGGARIATSVGGGATGEGGDVLIIDDAHKIEDATSKTARETTIDAFTNTFSTRLNPGPGKAIVVVSQRLHQRDLPGHLIETGEYTHLCLPAEYDPNHPYLHPDDPRTEPGQLLWPEMCGPAELERRKATLGSFGAAGQLQQLPAPAGGAIFRRHWWRWYDVMPARFEQIILSVDLSFEGGITSDYSVVQVWGKVEGDFYLLHQERERADFRQQITLIETAVAWVETETNYSHNPAVCIEKAANAAAIITTLRGRVRNLIPIQPEGSKETRAVAISPTIEGGHVYIPGQPNAQASNYDKTRTPLWVQQFVDETAAFPAAAHDDQVDAMTQAIRRLSNPGPRIRVLGGRY